MVLKRSLGRSVIKISMLHIPIPGFRTLAQVEDNCAALEKGPLTAQQMQEIQKILA